MPLTPEELEAEYGALTERRRRKERRRRRQRLHNWVAAAVGVVLTVASAYYTYVRGTAALSRLDPAGPAGVEDQRVKILFLGVDSREGRRGRADTVLVVGFDPRAGQVGVLSIPRDTRVSLPGRTRSERINATYATGGAALARAAVQGLVGAPIDYYVLVDFAAFESLVDLLGGVEIDVEQRMRYDDFAQGLHIDLAPGRQVLNGEQALHYVRYRGDHLGDVALVDPLREEYGGRVQRQLQFVKALAWQLARPHNLARLPQILWQARGLVDTDIPVDAAMTLALAARRIDAAGVETAVVPGTSETIGGASYWVPDPVRTRQLASRLIRGFPPVTVEVRNGNGVAGAATHAASRLTRAGFEVVAVGNAAHFEYPRTRVVAPGDPWTAREVSQALWQPADQPGVAQAAGMPVSGVLPAGEEEPRAQVLVILGQDYQTGL